MATLQSSSWTDVELAKALVVGAPEAMAHFDRVYVPRLESLLVRKGADPDTVDEIVQRLRVALVVEGKLRSFSGEGSLLGWLRVVVTRMWLNLRTRDVLITPEGDEDSALLRAMAFDEGPVAKYEREELRAALKEILLEALSELSNREKSLLRYAFADGVPLEQVARIYGVHRATATRWLHAARDRVNEYVRREVQARLHLSANSAIGAMDQWIGSTIVRYLEKR